MTSRLMRIICAVAIAAGLTIVGVDPAGAVEGDVQLSLTPTAPDLVLGEAVTVTIDVQNTGTIATNELAVHIDITRPDGSGSVDPEDWTATLTRQIGTVAAGAKTTVHWRLQPISGGTFRAYVIAVPVSSSELIFVSNAITVHVQDRRSLNPDGILPVALGAPAVVAALLATRLRPLRRNG